ncbi:MAG: peptide-methionine (S)-S-oxide reductase MsrA [Rhizobiales bacterium]|nr:peptide-methionine (S)-S-oxide reductase MsrA [Hyphomicrobiales bacterium]
MRKLMLAAAAAAVLSFASHANAETAVFAGGCFWCVESDMDKVKGVTSTTSGYAGGTLKNPTYENHEGHVEAVKVEFDPAVVSYDQLVARFLRTVDVTDDGGQFCDRGFAYTTAIFAEGAAQKASADAAIAAAGKSLGKKIATPVNAFTTFTDAEDYHQNYYQGDDLKLTRFGLIRQSDAYKRYRKACGRDARVKEVWGKEAFTAGVPAGGS